MSPKEQAHNDEKAVQEQRPAEVAERLPGQASSRPPPPALVRRVRASSGALKPEEVLQLQGVIGNQAVRRVVTPAPQAGPGSMRVQRRVLGRAVDPTNRFAGVTVRTYRIDDWQRFLQAAASGTRPAELNIFLAKAVGHELFVQEGDPEQRRHQRDVLESIHPPTRQECVGLMYALLSTPGIDLIGMMSPRFASVLGYLLPMFISRYYAAAMEYAARRSWGSPEDYEQWRVRAAQVAESVGQAGGAESFTGSAYATSYGPFGVPEPPEARQQRIASIGGAEGLGPSSARELQAQAMAGIEAAVAAATFGAVRDPQNWGDVTSRCNRRLEMHAQTLLGIIQRQRRIEAINAAVADAVIGVAFASMAAFTRRLQTRGGEEISRIARYDALERGLREAAKQGVRQLSRSAPTGSAAAIQTACASAFTDTLALHENSVSEEMGRVPNEVVTAHARLDATFTRQMALEPR